ncbi:Sorting nexin mvp1 [Ascosphaera acerosa]|nr:Sorting nexin mvp1 [Ascosphaera acerosa]
MTAPLDGVFGSRKVSGGSSTGFPPPPPPLATRPTFGGSAAWADAFPQSQGFLDPSLTEGFDQPRTDRSQTGANNLSRTLGGGAKVLAPVSDEAVSVVMLPEKEGVFMFQHRNYEVKSSRRGTSVIRRYSDFVWLHDCLVKKYPFRQIPLLPPKRVAADSSSFLDKRRRGLIRFTNALVQHPVLSQEQLVIMFFSVPTELSVWRKQATIQVQEEFTGKVMAPELADALPPTLSETFEVVRSGIKRSAEIYINLCNLFDRYARRCEGLGAEQYRIARSLQNLTDCMHDTYAADNKDVPMLNLGINATARHLIASQGLLEDETAAWNEGVLEDLKRQRDCLVAMRDLFDRRDKYARDNIAQLEGRIANNQKKLRDLKGKPEGTVKPTELERVENSIIADKSSIVQQHERGVLIKECVRDEILYFQASQYRISRLHQDWSQERVKYAELQASNWRSMAEEVEPMPLSG